MNTQGYFIDNRKPENERIVEGAVSTDQSYKISHKESQESSETSTENTETVSDTTSTEPQQKIIDDVQTSQSEMVAKPEYSIKPREAPVSVDTSREVPPPMRIFTKKIFVNQDAVHTCTTKVFTVDMKGRTSTQNTLILTKEADIAYEIEVGSLPTGIDVRFNDTNSYNRHIGLEDNMIDFTVTKKANAAIGSFTIPIIYTQKGVFDSSVICQINIVNR